MESIIKNPIVTVIMTVYNGEKYLSDAIDSILNQSFTDFEFLIVNDGSNDNTLEILKSYIDSRITIISHDNIGVSASCNKALKIARGKYIARQDADDFSKLDRLEKQVAFLEHNPEVGLLGSNYNIIDSNGSILETTDVFTTNNDLKLAIIFSNQFGQGTVMMRKDILNKTGRYVHSYKIAHDYDLWVKFSRFTQIANLPEALYYWRSAGEGLSTNPENIVRMETEVKDIRDKAHVYFLENKSDYKYLVFRPSTTRGGYGRYFHMKNTVFRNMSLLLHVSGYRRQAVLLLLLGILCEPSKSITYSQLIGSFNKKSLKKFTYETI